MNKFKSALVAATLALTAGAASAAPIYADKIISESYGTCTASAAACSADGRLNTANALGATDGKFHSLGLGGSLTVGFAQAMFSGLNDVSAFEITFNRTIGHNEAVDIYSVLGGVETFLGTLTNVPGNGSVKATTAFEHIKLVDATRRVFGRATSSFDGYDVDSVSVAAVPLPAAGLMLIAGLGGLAAVRRRKNAA